jgi:hypothetical protein
MSELNEVVRETSTLAQTVMTIAKFGLIAVLISVVGVIGYTLYSTWEGRYE